MRPVHKPSKDEVLYYENQLLQRGQGLHQFPGPVFIARYNQRGYGFGSVLAGLARHFLKSLGKSDFLISTKKSLKKRALEAGSSLAKDVLQDKKGIKRSLKEGAKKLVSNVITDVLSTNQSGKGKKRKRRGKEKEDIFSKRPRRVSDVFQI